MPEEYMKICMPVPEPNEMNSVIFGHFGSAPFFAMYDTEKKDVSFVSNNESEHEHGQCMPVGYLQKNGAEIVLCKGMGARAANLLISAGIKPYMVDADTVADAIKDFTSGKAVLMNESIACHEHDCH
jgi:predicted Fe-Mo cluster-binding NifX family protein